MKGYKTKFERNSSLNYFQMACGEKTNIQATGDL